MTLLKHVKDLKSLESSITCIHNNFISIICWYYITILDNLILTKLNLVMWFQVSDDHIYTIMSTSVKYIVTVKSGSNKCSIEVTANSETTIDLCDANDVEKVAQSGVLRLGVSGHSFIYAC